MSILYQVSNPDRYIFSFTEVNVILLCKICSEILISSFNFQLIVKQLQMLLDSLKGSPVGLKLNSELNNFFLGCFRYHVDLWATFLVIVAPVIKHLFVPLAVFGCLGFSFQLAMLSDILSIITLHAHCIYIYAAM